MRSGSPRSIYKIEIGAESLGPACCVGIGGGGFKSDSCVGAAAADAYGR